MNWRSVDLFLARECHLSPAAADRLTLAEIALLLEDPEKSRPVEGHAFGTDEELWEYQRWYRSLSISDRLALAREGRL